MVVRLSTVTANSHEARARRIGGWIGGILIGLPAAYVAWIGVVLSFARPPGTPYPWAGALLVYAECAGVVGVATLAGRAGGAALARTSRTPRLFLASSGLDLDALSDERLVTLWQTITAGNVPQGIPSYRVADASGHSPGGGPARAAA